MNSVRHAAWRSQGTQPFPSPCWVRGLTERLAGLWGSTVGSSTVGSSTVGSSTVGSSTVGSSTLGSSTLGSIVGGSTVGSTVGGSTVSQEGRGGRAVGRAVGRAICIVVCWLAANSLTIHRAPRRCRRIHAPPLQHSSPRVHVCSVASPPS